MDRDRLQSTVDAIRTVSAPPKPVPPPGRDDHAVPPVGSIVLIVCAILAAAFLLVGCASAPLVTGPETVRVEVPVPVKCIAAADVPRRPAPTRVDVDRASRTQVAAAVGADLLALDEYARKAAAAIAACTE